jgi:DNA-binding GntR family transcriptional regulator
MNSVVMLQVARRFNLAQKSSPSGPESNASGVSKTLAVYAQLSDELIDGKWLPGQRLSELELVRRYEVSRTPIREALVRLEHDGLIKREGTAVYVRERTPDEVLDIYRVRVFLEGAIAHSAAERRTDVDLMRLEGVLAREGAIEPGADGGVLQASNTEFHNVLASAARNFTLQEIQGRLTRQISRLPSTTLSYPGRWDVAVKEHYAIVAAVRDRNAEEAERIARAHMQAACDIRLALMAEELGARP